MKLLIVYATTEGHTRKVAEFMADVARAHKHSVEVCDSAMPVGFTKAGWDAVILGASVHQGQHQISLRNFIFENLPWLKTIPSAFFSVSLSAAVPEAIYQQEAQEYASSFLNDLDWQPHEVICIAGALVHSEYDYFKRMVLKLLAGQLAPGTVTPQDADYTDWDAVKAFTEGFLQRVSNMVAESSRKSF